MGTLAGHAFTPPHPCIPLALAPALEPLGGSMLMEGRVLLWDPLQLCPLAKAGGIGWPPGPGPWGNFLSRRSTHVCSEIEVPAPWISFWLPHLPHPHSSRMWGCLPGCCLVTAACLGGLTGPRPSRDHPPGPAGHTAPYYVSFMSPVEPRAQSGKDGGGKAQSG